MDGNTRICKKCLLREMDEAGFFQNMYDYIARIPADDKAPEEEYERRLSICKECEKLLSGMCRMCGVLRISEVGKISWDSFASPVRLLDP